MTKTSHKKNRPFDFKLIDLVEPHPTIYLRQPPGMTTFDVMKAKTKIWEEISEQMGYPIQFCISRWNNLRGQFQKELRQSIELCPKSGVIKGSTWPYLERMRFLECTVQAYKQKKERMSKRKAKALFELKKEGVDGEEEVTEQEHEQQDQEHNWSSEDSQATKLPEEMDDDFQIEVDDVGEHVVEEHFSDSFSIIEEIAEEVIAEEHIIEDTGDNFRKMQSLLMGFEGETRCIIERRILSFICKCQLRSLCNQGIEDLFV